MSLPEERRFRRAFWAALVFGLMLLVAAYALTANDSDPNPLIVEVGKAGATLAIVVVIGGLVREAFTGREVARLEREEELAFYRRVLADFKTVYDSVERCRLLVEAHRSAKTYGEQIRALSDAVITLHNVRRALDPEFPRLRDQLAPHIAGCNAFVKGLIFEFRDNYVEISRLQSIDEAVNKRRRERLVVEGGGSMDVSRTAWEQMSALPKLGILRDDSRYEEYEDAFVAHIDAASAVLRRRLPVSERPG